MTFAILHGAVAEWPTWVVALGCLTTFLFLAWRGAAGYAFAIGAAAALWLIGAPTWLLIVLAVPTVILLWPLPRRMLISGRVMRTIAKLGMLPTISETERAAIEAGTTWVDAELFSGKPNWDVLLAQDYPDLKPDEKAFLDGPVEQLCKMTDDWEVHQRRDLPPEVWEFVKKERFFGLIIPKEYGGLGFGALVNSAVVAKLASRSLPLAVTVMVPNSLGPAELLIHYGTEAQKQHWLPRLANGTEIPCFALTEPGAGSDAGSITSSGVVFRGEDGKPWLRLQWDKRYITLAAVATVLGLAFRMRDPENLLGRGVDLGITCALIPTDTPGVVLGRRHDPLGVPFYNCPTQGHDVVVPIDAILGGVDGAGRGWRMLMECLAAGRGISIPACATGGTQLVARVASAHAAVRRQFGLPIGRFEGVEEPLARIASSAYVLEASRRYTCGGLDRGAKPSVVTAIVKYQTSETFRRVIDDGMDVLGGNAISMGPRNLLAHGYIGAPISITVEGANILTRTLMIFGQGAIRCHPFARKEIEAIAAKDVKAFDRAVFGHVRHVVRNAVRCGLLSVTRGRLAHSPVGGPAARAFQKLAWASASFATLADLAMATLAGDLKRKEKLTGRFADVFSWMYLATATLKRFEAEGRREIDVPVFRYAMDVAFARMQEAFDGIYRNLDVPVLGWFLRGPVALWSRLNPFGAPPSDRLSGRVARALQQAGPFRDGLASGIHVPTDPSEALGRLERAFVLSCRADETLNKIKDAVRSGQLPKDKPERLVKLALERGYVSDAEAELLQTAEAARADAIAVDSFTLEEYLRTAVDVSELTGSK